MARKPVLDGGKRDEIIAAATELFFENGYEATSVRMILDKVGGEVGMFYHYFKSKDELFTRVAERFFSDYAQAFILMSGECEEPEQFLRAMLEHYGQGMRRFEKISGNMHWTIQYAMLGKTLTAIEPAVERMLERWGYESARPLDITAGQLLFAISATLHAQSFKAMPAEQQLAALEDCLHRLLDVPKEAAQ